LRVSIILGLLFATYDFLLGEYSIIEKYLNPDIPVGFASILVAISIFGGIQLIMLGMAGEYIGRIFLSQNNKPQYTIRKSYEE
jgi:glycosyltransferase involved in cell wall biosynthesis